MNKPAAITSVLPEDYPRVVAVWEASVRATHHFITEANIAFFRPLVQDGLPKTEKLIGTRDDAGQMTAFLGMEGEKVEMLFVHPTVRGRGLGRLLLTHAITNLGATLVDVNEQNEQAVGFYQRLGFVVIGCSPLDGTGKPYPILHLQLADKSAH